MSDQAGQNIEASVLAERERERAEREREKEQRERERAEKERERDTRDESRDRSPTKEGGGAEATCRDGGAPSRGSKGGRWGEERRSNSEGSYIVSCCANIWAGNPNRHVATHYFPSDEF